MRLLKTVKWLLFLSAIVFAEAGLKLNVDNTTPSTGEIILLKIEAEGVKSLDTYSITLSIPSDAVKVLSANIDAPLNEITNLLKSNGGSVIPLIKQNDETVTISATLKGDKNAVNGKGVLGVISLEVLSEETSKISIISSDLINAKKEKITHKTLKNITINGME